MKKLYVSAFRISVTIKKIHRRKQTVVKDSVEEIFRHNKNARLFWIQISGPLNNDILCLKMHQIAW